VLLLDLLGNHLPTCCPPSAWGRPTVLVDLSHVQNHLARDGTNGTERPLLDDHLPSDTARDARPQARRGKSMSRRSGQNGSPQKEGNWYIVRFWKDVEGQEQRKRIYERVCPISGPGKLSASARERKAKEIIAASGADSVEHFQKVVRSNHGVTFREQAVTWLEYMRNRKRDPVAPSTLDNWERCLKNWLNPHIGDLPLDSIKNLTLKNLGVTMVKGGLGASAIRSYTNAVKMVVASAVNEEGEVLHPRQWNHSFIDLPKDNHPHRPGITGKVATDVVASADGQCRVLFALMPSAGLRFGEALGIDIKDISPDCCTIKIRQKAWRGQIHDYLKTPNGDREIDLHPAMATILKGFVGSRKGLLFCSRTGKQLFQSNILRRELHPILEKLGQPKCGAHVYRRFRLTHLRMHNVPKDLEHFWMGHDGEEIGDIYSKLKNDVAFRQEVTNRIGLGFEIPSKSAPIGRNGRKIESEAAGKVAVSA
jgi:integrase